MRRNRRRNKNSTQILRRKSAPTTCSSAPKRHHAIRYTTATQKTETPATLYPKETYQQNRDADNPENDSTHTVWPTVCNSISLHVQSWNHVKPAKPSNEPRLCNNWSPEKQPDPLCESAFSVTARKWSCSSRVFLCAERIPVPAFRRKHFPQARGSDRASPVEWE